MIGGGSGMEMLREQAATEGLANMRFEPYQPKRLRGEGLTASDVHLVSLKHLLEGHVVPGEFYGIFAAGRPIMFLGDRTGEIAAIMRQHDYGLIVPAGEPRVLRDYTMPRSAAAVVEAARVVFQRTRQMGEGPRLGHTGN